MYANLLNNLEKLKLDKMYSYLSKKIIGYAFGKKMTNDLVSKALKSAYYSQNPDKNKLLIFHSDLGSQYTSNDLKELCTERNI